MTFNRMAPNCSGVCRRVLPMMVALSWVPGEAGRPPSWPEEICTFCAWMALFTSTGVSW
ncbi:hypothetical protein D9M71_637780 [compost metagenome]